MENNILIVGGYGTVGSVISQNLSKTYPGRVIVAGRTFMPKIKSSSNSLTL